MTLVDSIPTSGEMVTAYVHERDGKHFLYTGGGEKYLDSFVVADDGSLTPLKRYTMWKNKGPARGVVSASIEGNEYLFVGNKFGDAIEVHTIHEDGTLTRIKTVEDTEETHVGIVITMEVIQMGDALYLFVGGLENTPGLTSFKIEADGSLVHVHSIKDDLEIFTDGIIAMKTHRSEGKTFLVTGGFQDSGLSSFQVFDDGTFKNISNIGDDETRFLTGTYPVSGVTLGGNNYVIAGHRHHTYYNRGNFIKHKDFVYHGDAVTIFKLDNNGVLSISSVLENSEETLLRGQTRIETFKINENEAVISVGTREDTSIQTIILDKNGKTRASNVTLIDFPVYNGMTSKKIAENLFLFAGSYGEGRGHLSSFRIDLEKPESN